ncbi:uncharacterized protein LOC126853786 isoform X2 [Cataglyphis hispanica]|uniref:uncharacterized protein LOC126853786 isoform X2 n=1 Tax=Cataglyphis hispanica TaxID=1086592 RepID=UPI00218062A1|nr:uncharacterized protein LOC126853786 isoform X2 [Cataglyphis hispanica]
MKRADRAKFIVITLCSILLFLCYSGVDAIQCYQCNSLTNSLCSELIPPDTMKIDCLDLRGGKKYTMCRKITQTIEISAYELQPNTRIIRGCGWDESSYKNMCYKRNGFGAKQEVCSCSNDYCNAATPGSGILPSQGLIFSCALMSTLLAFLRN